MVPDSYLLSNLALVFFLFHLYGRHLFISYLFVKESRTTPNDWMRDATSRGGCKLQTSSFDILEIKWLAQVIMIYEGQGRGIYSPPCLTSHLAENSGLHVFSLTDHLFWCPDSDLNVINISDSSALMIWLHISSDMLESCWLSWIANHLFRCHNWLFTF